MNTAYVNGRYLPLAEASLSLLDPGFVWGATVTDRTRTFGGRPFELDAHIRRFRQSCELACVPLEASDAQIATIANTLFARDGTDPDVSLVMLATPGPTLILHTQPLDWAKLERIDRTGARLVQSSATLGTNPWMKHRSRLPWWIAARELRQYDPDSEPLFVDRVVNSVTETASANLLAFINDTVVSPPRVQILRGIALDLTEQLCRQLRLPFVESTIDVNDLGHASEVLLTNSTFGVVGVAWLNGNLVPFPGPILRRLQSAWSHHLGVNIRPTDKPNS